MKNLSLTILKETLIQMIISFVLVAIAAFVILKTSPSEGIVSVIVLVIYGISAFVGGYILGKVMNKRKFLWGALAGAIYIGILLIIALIVRGSVGDATINPATGIIVSLAAGMAGGMIS